MGHLVAPQPTLSVLCQTTYTIRKQNDNMFYNSLTSFPAPCMHPDFLSLAGGGETDTESHVWNVRMERMVDKTSS